MTVGTFYQSYINEHGLNEGNRYETLFIVDEK